MATSAPAFLSPDWRYAGDDWAGDNALTYIVYETAPVYAADGITITTSGTPRDLTGATVVGSLRLQSPAPFASGPTCRAAVGSVIDALNGVIALSLSRAATQLFERQALSAWGDPAAALLIVQPRVVTAAGQVSVGLQPLFVF